MTVAEILVMIALVGQIQQESIARSQRDNLVCWPDFCWTWVLVVREIVSAADWGDSELTPSVLRFEQPLYTIAWQGCLDCIQSQS